MKILEQPITRAVLSSAYTTSFKDMVKGVADIRRKLVALDADLHADLEQLLLDRGSDSDDLWGFNLYPFRNGDAFIEYTSLINIRPHLNNTGMEVTDARIRQAVRVALDTWVVP